MTLFPGFNSLWNPKTILQLSFLAIMSILRWCNTKQKSVQDDNSFFMTSFKPFKKENELRLVLMLFLVFERNSEVPWFESKCDIGNSDQKFRQRENHP